MAYAEVDQLLALMPDLSEERAEQVLEAASLAIDAYLYPFTVPDPVPPPISQATVLIAYNIAAAPTPGAVIAEGVGAYNYRLATPGSATAIPQAALELLKPWLPSGGCYQLVIWPGETFDLPVDWWQRDLDNPDDYGTFGAPIQYAPADQRLAALSGWSQPPLPFALKKKPA